MAKQLLNTTDPSLRRQIYTTFHSTHHHLTMFLAHQTTPFPQPSLLLPTENSLSSPVDGVADEPMQVGEDKNENEAEQVSKNTVVDGVEERVREVFVQNKRPKSSPSPPAAADQGRSYENEAVGQSSVAELDPHGTKLTSLDHIYQFHG